MRSEQEFIQLATDYQYKTKELERAYVTYAEFIESFPSSQNVSLAKNMMYIIECQDENIKLNGKAIVENARAERIKKEKERIEFASSFNEFYEYDVVSVINKDHGPVDKQEIRRVLMEYARNGWKLHSIYSNELGKNAIRHLGYIENSTACEDVMIFERRVEKIE